MGDAHLAAEAGIYNFDMAAAYAKWLRDMKDEQKEDGSLPGIVPTGGWGYAWGNGPAWDSAYPLICWDLYLYYGDTRILEEHYDRLKRYVDYVTSRSKDLMPSFGLGDWVCLKEQTPVKITSTGYFYVDACIVAKAAKVLGRVDDQAKYEELAARIKKAFQEKYVDEDGGLNRKSQCALACALYQGLVDKREPVLKQLLENVEKNKDHLNCGFLGYKYLLHSLPPEVAFRVASQKTFPGWGAWFEQGATSLWETWQGKDSLNHIAFGDISAWFYEVLAGITMGTEHVVIEPHPVGDLTWVKAAWRRVRVEWKKDNGFELSVSIPANMTATVRLPNGRTEEIGSGEYTFK
jgi:alpha-L-rhamnosidase